MNITWERNVNSITPDMYYLSRNGINIYPWIRLIVYRSANNQELDMAWLEEKEQKDVKPVFLNSYEYLWIYYHPEEFYMEQVL